MSERNCILAFLLPVTHACNVLSRVMSLRVHFFSGFFWLPRCMNPSPIVCRQYAVVQIPFDFRPLPHHNVEIMKCCLMSTATGCTADNLSLEPFQSDDVLFLSRQQRSDSCSSFTSTAFELKLTPRWVIHYFRVSSSLLSVDLPHSHRKSTRSNLRSLFQIRYSMPFEPWQSPYEW